MSSFQGLPMEFSAHNHIARHIISSPDIKTACMSPFCQMIHLSGAYGPPPPPPNAQASPIPSIRGQRFNLPAVTLACIPLASIPPPPTTSAASASTGNTIHVSKIHKGSRTIMVYRGRPASRRSAAPARGLACGRVTDLIELIGVCHMGCSDFRFMCVLKSIYFEMISPHPTFFIQKQIRYTLHNLLLLISKNKGLYYYILLVNDSFERFRQNFSSELSSMI